MQSDRLIHYSSKPLVEVRDADQTGRALRGDKPGGLWVSVEGEDDWKSWCECEGFALDRLAHQTEVVLADNANVLRVVGYVALKNFHNKYRVEPKPGEPEFLRDLSIHWDRVADEYDGIIIAPYIWSLRLDGNVRWYYGWDCASGCIWRARAIKQLIPISSGEPCHADVLLEIANAPEVTP